MPYILQTNHLTKLMKGKKLVQDVNIHVKKGEIYGFLGPNGAGKTTVMKMITNLWKPTEGYIELFGQALTPKSYGVLKRMGSIIEFPVFYGHMTGYENLNLHCEYMGYYDHGVPKNPVNMVDMKATKQNGIFFRNDILEALDMLGLGAAADMPVKNYSLGMKQRLGIARAMLCKPELLVLDEPTNGLDPAGMKQIRELFRMLCTEYGITIIVSSHILSEVESIADTIGVINHGMMQKEISMKEISEMNTEYIELTVTDTHKASYVLADKMALNHFRVLDEQNMRIYDGRITTKEISKTLALNDVEIIFIGRKSESLEDYFLKITEEE